MSRQAQFGHPPNATHYSPLWELYYQYANHGCWFFWSHSERGAWLPCQSMPMARDLQPVSHTLH